MLDNLGDDLKKVMLLGVGAVAAAAEKCTDAKEVVDELVKKGELTLEQGKVLNEELKCHVKEKVNAVLSEKKDDRLHQKISKMSKEERDALREKLEAMDKEEDCECDCAQ